jgi:hypothetical protein
MTVKTFRIKYTELKNDNEIEGEMVVESKNIVKTLERFSSNREILKMRVNGVNKRLKK